MINGVYDLNILNQFGMFDDQTREWILIATTIETSMTIIGVTPDEEVTFGVTASNAGGESEMSTATSAGGSPEVTLETPYDVLATGEDFEDPYGAIAPAITVTWSDSNDVEPCGDGYVDDCDGSGECCLESWIGDGFADCEDQQWGCDLTCYENDGGDCDEDGGGDGGDG